MGCLFGYCGPRFDGVLEKMARVLSHRCVSGWERVEARTAQGRVIEIGRGIAPWAAAKGPNITASAEGDAARPMPGCCSVVTEGPGPRTSYWPSRRTIRTPFCVGSTERS